MYTMGNNDFALTYTQYSASANGAAIVGSESDYDASQIALGWFHNFSKNTVVKTVYSKIDNNKQGTYFGRMGVASSLASPAAGSDPSSFQVSIQTSRLITRSMLQQIRRGLRAPFFLPRIC